MAAFTLLTNYRGMLLGPGGASPAQIKFRDVIAYMDDFGPFERGARQRFLQRISILDAEFFRLRKESTDAPG